MAKKKNLKDLDLLEQEFINEKLKGDSNSILNYRNSDDFFSASSLKALTFKLEIKCKNEKQKEFLKQLKEKKKEICFGIGSPGTGKSFLSLAYALKELKEGKYDKIIMVVPTVQAGGADMSLGFLKGDFFSKVEPFQQADIQTITKILRLSGNVSPEFHANALVGGGFIQYEFINFMLGKTFDNSLILVNEAEQYSKSNLRLLLTRVGDNSKLVITGDAKQVNRKSILNKTDICGLTYAVDKLGDMDEVSITEFTDEDIVRNKLITKILSRWDD